jgi:hypothetical protein
MLSSGPGHCAVAFDPFSNFKYLNRSLKAFDYTICEEMMGTGLIGISDVEVIRVQKSLGPNPV